VIGRPQTSLFHLVAVRGDSKRRTLLAYVEYFGAMRILVDLSSKFEGNDFETVYAIDPLSGGNMDLSVDWDIPADELHSAFTGSGVVAKNFDHACRSATTIASHIREKRERRHVHYEELFAVLSQLGIQPGATPDPKDRDSFNRMMEKN
jgi:hypothetical protein